MAFLRNILYVSLVILSVCFAITAYKIQGRIVGGSNAKREDYPHNVAFLLEYGLVMCGGSIISDRMILSAASCMEDFVDTPYQLFAAFQSKITSEDDIAGATIDRIVLHPSYKEKHFTDDLALLRTTEKIEFTPQIQPIGLPTAPLPSDDGQVVTISGWGFLKEPVDNFPFPKLAESLQCQRTKTIGLRECKRLYVQSMISEDSKGSKLVSRFGKNNICTENSQNKGLCIGDMGNALVSEDGKLVAVASWVFGCGQGLPDVYTKTYPYLGWIKTGIQAALIDEEEEEDDEKQSKQSPTSGFRAFRDKILNMIRL